MTRPGIGWKWLHDVGKIGIPDRILRKPGKLTVDEQLIMDRSVQHGLGILRGCTTDTALLDIFFMPTVGMRVAETPMVPPLEVCRWVPGCLELLTRSTP